VADTAELYYSFATHLHIPTIIEVHLLQNQAP
jgi:hypothetical protein